MQFQKDELFSVLVLTGDKYGKIFGKTIISNTSIPSGTLIYKIIKVNFSRKSKNK